MRTSISAIALIAEQRGNENLWLAQWNSNWRSFCFVGGHKSTNESFRECVIREVTEELGLQFESEFFVADAPASRLAYTAWSRGSKEETVYTMELFVVQLTERAGEKVNADQRNRWLTEDQIRARTCESGEPVSETMEMLLTRVNLLESNSE